MLSESNTNLPAVTVERHGGKAIVIVRVNFSEEERDGSTVYTFDEEHGETPYFDGLEASVSENAEAWHANFKKLNADKLDRPATPMERIEAKLDALLTYQVLTVQDLGGGVLEVVKPDDMDKPLGDYLNPRRWVEGMAVKTGDFYFYEDYDMRLEALADGIPASWGAEPFERYNEGAL